MSRIHRTTVEMTDANAPIPACFALTGFSDFQTRKRMRPTIGKKNPNTAHPNDPVSAGCGFTIFWTGVPGILMPG